MEEHHGHFHRELPMSDRSERILANILTSCLYEFSPNSGNEDVACSLSQTSPEPPLQLRELHRLKISLFIKIMSVFVKSIPTVGVIEQMARHRSLLAHWSSVRPRPLHLR